MLEKKYNHMLIESDKFEIWKNCGYFESGDITKEPYSIILPPPNVTGVLHLGHAWDVSLQDILIRYKRMDGYDTLWLPSKDHAGIATQAKVDAKLKAEGINPREMDRSLWLAEAWKWVNEHSHIINEQWARLGLSLDYNKERFTMDEGLSNAVTETFIKMYERGLIYRGHRVINFDPEALTALSNIEVIHKEIEGAFYHLKYNIIDSDDYLEIATTRPETIFGDTGVAVNPNDERYKDLIGKKVIVPIVNREIPIVADDYADMEFGTGVVKITPAHDINDFEVGNRHDLPRLVCMNMNGTMNEEANIYAGMDRFDARKALIKDLESSGLLIKTENMVHSVGFSERTDVMVEPYLSEQWFIKMDGLANQVMDRQANKETRVNFFPANAEKVLTSWLTNIEDWCISRQLWWGHRIPAWYKDGEIHVGKESPGDGWTQDEDVLDTWFSSGLLPFSTLGWPEDLNTRYYPNNVLVCGFDIIFFWAARMMFFAEEFTNDRPFNDLIIHGLIRDKNGVKMSKSLGNGVDPMDVCEEYGADALRFSLATNNTMGQDLKYNSEKVKSTWNFINKIWNASRFVLMNLEDFKPSEINVDDLNLADKWILAKMNNTIKQVRINLDKYEFNNAGNELYRFIWEDFCDNYIELSKASLDNKNTLNVLHLVLTNTLKLLHPFMPFVTEEIYSEISSESIMISNYPVYLDKYNFDQELKLMDEIILDITNIRNFKVANNVPKTAIYKLDTKYPDIYLTALKNKPEQLDLIPDDYNIINYHSNLIKLEIGLLEETNLDDLADTLLKEQAELESVIKRRTGLLSNENYVSKAPADLVAKEKEQLAKEELSLDKIKEQLSDLQK